MKRDSQTEEKDSSRSQTMQTESECISIRRAGPRPSTLSRLTAWVPECMVKYAERQGRWEIVELKCPCVRAINSFYDFSIPIRGFLVEDVSGPVIPVRRGECGLRQQSIGTFLSDDPGPGMRHFNIADHTDVPGLFIYRRRICWVEASLRIYPAPSPILCPFTHIKQTN